jgi:hypothetical protein
MRRHECPPSDNGAEDQRKHTTRYAAEKRGNKNGGKERGKWENVIDHKAEGEPNEARDDNAAYGKKIRRQRTGHQSTMPELEQNFSEINTVDQ